MAGFKKFDPYAFLERERQLEAGKSGTLGGLGGLGGLPADRKKRVEKSSTYRTGIHGFQKHEGRAPKPPKPPKAESLSTSLGTLERRRPEHIDQDRWRRAVEDGRLFLETWGELSVAFEWTAEELFGLHEPPPNPHPSYRRLARYDCTGLIWLLAGNPVVALTKDTAAIQHKSTGSITIYRKELKTALGPIGDSLEDFV